MSRMLVVPLALAAMLAFTASAQAHAYLESAAPAVDSVTAPPSEIRINFSEEVVAKFSGLVLKNEAGKTVPTGKAKSGADKSVLVAPLKRKLASGAYDVEWYCVSADTHRMKGRYRFTVR